MVALAKNLNTAYKYDVESQKVTHSAYNLFEEAYKITTCSKQQRRLFVDYTRGRNQLSVVPNSFEHNPLVFDFETTGLSFGSPSVMHDIVHNMDIECRDIRPFGIALCFIAKDKLVLVWARAETQLWYECLGLLRTRWIKVAHNARYDLRVAGINNILINGLVDCTLTMGRIIWDRREEFDLKSLSPIVCHELADYEDELKAILKNMRGSYTRAGYPKGYVNYSFIPDEIICIYAMKDAFGTMLLWLRLKPDVVENYLELYKRERKIIKIVKNIEMRGMHFNRIRASVEIAKIKKEVPKLESKLFKICGRPFNQNSYKQLRTILIEDMEIPERMFIRQGKLTTDVEQLEKVVKKLEGTNDKAKDFVDTLLELRSYQKLNGTYLEPLYRRASYCNGIIFCNINPTDSKTGRMSSNDPNLQNIPRPKTGFAKHNPVRKCFTNRRGFINFFIDYSQMEMWVFAICAKETKMLDALMRGADIHGTVAYELWGEEALDDNGEEKTILIEGKLVKKKLNKDKRMFVKTVNFGIIYGMGFKGLAKSIKRSLFEAHDILQRYYAKYPRIVEYINECKELLYTQGYVEDIMGKRYHVDPRESHKAVNCIVQGGCAQLIKDAMIKIDNFLGDLRSWDGKAAAMLLQIHDELVFELPANAPLWWMKMVMNRIAGYMENVPTLKKLGYKLFAETTFTLDSWEDKQKADWSKMHEILKKAA
jgi:DNA polymerase I-like protein with 3'-5' exonuclease and polymerase domains